MLEETLPGRWLVCDFYSSSYGGRGKKKKRAKDLAIA